MSVLRTLCFAERATEATTRQGEEAEAKQRHRILLLGDGDLSLSRSIALKLVS